MLALVFIFISSLAIEYEFSLVSILKKYKNWINSVWVIGGFLILYLCWDLFTIVYAQSKQGVWEKYKVVLLMIFLVAAILFYTVDEEKINRILMTIAFSGIFSGIMSILNYAFFRIYPIYYGKRLSIRLDYNMFASVIIMGLVCGYFLILQSKLNFKKKVAAVFLLCLFTVPFIILSSSRRNYILLFPILSLFLIDAIFCAVKKRNSRKKRAVYRVLLAAFGILLSVLVSTNLLSMYLSYAYEGLKDTAKGGFLLEGESSAKERYETIEKEAVSSKRSLIWGIAIDEASGYTPQQKAVGKGFGYDRILYKTSENMELRAAYNAESREKLSAHCFFLADILNGGFVQGGISIFLWGSIGVFLLILLNAYPIFAQIYVIAFGLIFMNNFISNRYGFLYDKYFWIFLALLSAEIYLIKSNKRRIFSK